jgi:hypothetical protein
VAAMKCGGSSAPIVLTTGGRPLLVVLVDIEGGDCSSESQTPRRTTSSQGEVTRTEQQHEWTTPLDAGDALDAAGTLLACWEVVARPTELDVTSEPAWEAIDPAAMAPAHTHAADQRSVVESPASLGLSYPV